MRLLKLKLFTCKYANYLRRAVRELLKVSEYFNDSEPYSAWLRQPDFIAAQVGIFLLAGFETSSSLIALILYELAKQPVI